MTKIFLKFKKSIEKYDLIKENDNVLVSFSGGPDSTALVLLLKKLKKYIDFDFSLIYFNHNLRDDSEEEEKKVKEFANKFSLNLIIKRFYNLKSIKSNIEEKAREERYKFLKEKAISGKFNKIATAHTLNDQVETFFMRLFRGSGSEGLSSIPVIRDDLFIRPLLEIKKEEIISYLNTLNIEYYIDKTNLETKFLRNKIRNRLLPIIEKEFNPAIFYTIKNIIDILYYDEKFIDKICSEKLNNLLSDDNTLDTKRLKDEQEAIKRRIIRKYIKVLKGNLRKISYKHIETILGLKEGQKTDIPDLTLTIKNGKLTLYKEQKNPAFEYKIKSSPEKIYIKEIGKNINVFKSNEKPPYDDKIRGIIDYNKVKFPITVRNRKPGDNYKPIGLKGKSKKIKDIFIDKKIDKDIRDSLPLFINGDGEIIWVLNLGISDIFKTDKNTKEYLIIEISYK